MDREISMGIGPSPPHEALFIAIAYLPLFELLAARQVCRSLREAVDNDILPWLHIVAKNPLNVRITDGILMEITSKAKGRLRALALINCMKITDDGLHRVIERNPLITKLYVPGCTGLTTDGVIRAMKTLTKHNHNPITLKINGIYNTNKHHLDTLHSILRPNHKQQEEDQQIQHDNFYHNHNHFPSIKHEETGCPIDIDVCPKCDQVRMVFDCPRKNCECRGCSYCVTRCVECGRCVEFEEVGDAACVDTLCLDCWIRLPKCSLCNRPYCNRHANQGCSFQGSTGLVCDGCHFKFLRSSDD